MQIQLNGQPPLLPTEALAKGGNKRILITNYRESYLHYKFYSINCLLTTAKGHRIRMTFYLNDNQGGFLFLCNPLTDSRELIIISVCLTLTYSERGLT